MRIVILMSLKIIQIYCPNSDNTLIKQFLEEFNIKEEQMLDILYLKNDSSRIIYIERSKK